MDTKLTKITVNLITEAALALDEVCDMTGLRKTDAVNRALQIYAFLEKQRRYAGKKISLVDPEGSIETVWIIS